MFIAAKKTSEAGVLIENVVGRRRPKTTAVPVSQGVRRNYWRKIGASNMAMKYLVTLIGIRDHMLAAVHPSISGWHMVVCARMKVSSVKEIKILNMGTNAHTG
jgi:hypothetical protein|tara:strand:- start:617 stop:925 length:309 start_codon:yes stop_codon:yes gene_type:complete